MDKMALLKWLTAQSNIYKHVKQYQDFDENIYSLISVESEIHVRGALLICETLNIPFTMEDWSNEDAKAERVTFEWNGVKFFSLENFRTESEVK
jgi:hypothetical protein